MELFAAHTSGQYERALRRQGQQQAQAAHGSAAELRQRGLQIAENLRSLEPRLKPWLPLVTMRTMLEDRREIERVFGEQRAGGGAGGPTGAATVTVPLLLLPWRPTCADALSCRPCRQRYPVRWLRRHISAWQEVLWLPRGNILVSGL